MASIDVGGGHGGKKSVDSQLPLVPFIDLLLCCVMFLLVTAVWNEMARVAAHVPATGTADTPSTDAVTNELIVHVGVRQYVVSTTSGLRDVIERNEQTLAVATLFEKLHALHEIDPTLKEAQIGADDGVSYADLITAMDTAIGAGFKSIGVSND